MKMLTEEQPVQVSGTTKDFSFGIEADGMPVIIEIISNKIYSDKILAVIREYSCNAFDANKDANKPKTPIRITLPTNLDPVFKVRDFGKGMTESEIENIFVKYGTSTKRNSNKFVGMFGIGSKSGFAYGTAFVVSSYCNGKRRDYSAFMDNKMPKMSLLAEDDTTEENGLEIQIPVRLPDIQYFLERARSFFRYWTIKPEIRGGKLEFPIETIVLEDKNWKVHAVDSYSSYSNRMIAVMGNVPYPLDASALSLDSRLSNLTGFPITMTFNIGDLGVNAGREGLEYDDRTKANILKHLNEIADNLSTKVGEQFSGLKTMFECKKKLNQVFDQNGPVRQMAQFVNKDNIKFNGVPVSSSAWGSFRKYLSGNIVGEKSFKIVSYQGSYGKPTAMGVSSIVASDTSCVVINDDNSQHGILNKIAPILALDDANPLNCLKKKYQQVYLVTIEDQAQWDKWVKEQVFDMPTVNLSKLTKVKLKDIYGVTYDNSASIAAQKTSVFTLDFETVNRSRYALKRDYYKASEVDLKTQKGLYIIIERFFVKVPKDAGVFQKISNGSGHSGAEPCQLIDMVRELNEIKNPKGAPHRYPTVYALRERDIANLGPNMKCFFKTFAPQFTKAIVDKSLLRLSAERVVALAASSGMSFTYFNTNREKLAKGSALAKFFEKYESMLHEKERQRIEKFEQLINRYNVQVTRPVVGVNLHDEYATIINRYPMIKLLCYSSRYGNPEVTLEETLAYMSLMDKDLTSKGVI